MPYALSATVVLGAANSGLTLTVALYDSANAAAAGLTTTTLVEVAAGSGTYLWTGTVPDGHRGYIRFDSGGVFKAAVSINGQEVENPDVKTSTRSSHSAADVWAVAERTLTSFGTLVADVATAVWTYVTRELTQVITAVTPPPVITGDTITLRRGDTATIAITGLGSLVGRTKLWFTVKLTSTDTDAEAILQVEETAGLLRLNGAAATAGQGSIVVNDAAAGNITITIAAAAMASIQPSSRYEYDVQMLAAAGVETLTIGSLTVLFDVTSSVS